MILKKLKLSKKVSLQKSVFVKLGPEVGDKAEDNDNFVICLLCRSHYLRHVQKSLPALGAEVIICVRCRSWYLRPVQKSFSASGAEFIICVRCRSHYLRPVQKSLSASGAEVIICVRCRSLYKSSL